ncbi:hypothetical protein DPX16_19424 [Anabarilius grahami]|uniref:Uncharacterized protein n=1 Tax=Anabarilius grahami TaxID=495550 RepID=A0A3N0Z026_ANAGA|nr:hypothetical protein DPX16_19424 [Anabarilius grahami]
MHPEDNQIQAKLPPAGGQSCISMKRGVERPFLVRGCVGDCNWDSILSAARDVDPDPVGFSQCIQMELRADVTAPWTPYTYAHISIHSKPQPPTLSKDPKALVRFLSQGSALHIQKISPNTRLLRPQCAVGSEVMLELSVSCLCQE